MTFLITNIIGIVCAVLGFLIARAYYREGLAERLRNTEHSIAQENYDEGYAEGKKAAPILDVVYRKDIKNFQNCFELNPLRKLLLANWLNTRFMDSVKEQKGAADLFQKILNLPIEFTEKMYLITEAGFLVNLMASRMQDVGQLKKEFARFLFLEVSQEVSVAYTVREALGMDIEDIKKMQPIEVMKLVDELKLPKEYEVILLKMLGMDEKVSAPTPDGETPQEGNSEPKSEEKSHESIMSNL